jgi:hypothetical protein
VWRKYSRAARLSSARRRYRNHGGKDDEFWSWHSLIANGRIRAESVPPTSQPLCVIALMMKGSCLQSH